MSRRVKVAVFVSGSGSNLQALIDQQKKPDWPAEIALVVSDKPACYALERARMSGLSVLASSLRDYPDKAAYEAAILAELRTCQVEWIILAGYMKIVGDTLLDAYPNRIVNIHPSLLPAFPGKQAVKDALLAGATETGVTVHYVDAGMDTGPIIAQERVAIKPQESEESLLERIHRVEHQLYPRVIQSLLQSLDG